jgi:hypothetical protein
VDVTLPFEFTASGRLAYQWIERNRNFGTPDYLWYSIGISRPLPLGFTASLAWYDTNLSQNDCFAGQKVCDGPGGVHPQPAVLSAGGRAWVRKN